MTFGEARQGYARQQLSQGEATQALTDDDTYLAQRADESEAALQVAAMNRESNQWTAAQAPDVFAKGIE